jgi:hypothetical protein
MKSPQRNRIHPTLRVHKHERGTALLITVLVMLLVSAVAMASLNQAGQESAAGGRTRATTRNFYAADSGIQLARKRLGSSPPDTTPFSVVLDGGRTVESRRRSETGPQPLIRTGYGPPPAGHEINLGSSNFSNEIYLINITSTAPGGTTAEVEAKIVVLQAE